MNKQLPRVSRRLSLVLRHNPGSIGITLDSGGWVGVKTLLAALADHGLSITVEQLAEVVETNDKRRFVIADGRIRAQQGHSIPVDLGLEAAEPPRPLFHGTASHNLESIMSKGLLPGRRHHVHLSADVATARQVGSRHGRVVVLTVDTETMTANGTRFFRSGNGVWLTDHVPPTYLTIEASPAR